ncbi:hypothetical protein PHPALM_28930 [Phytophthora palmivora]|uniref:Uncharacterized protein n=1 Tax=Phytophthora palmivora TaxID=4796 RepID=A0A2P4X8U7_9STRA|nr:hypothetical protein PHPALM_28930 [Phytophthora palmivora]
MTAWLATHFPETIDTNTNKMQIPLSNDAVLAFFGHICSPVHLCDRDNLDSKTYRDDVLALGMRAEEKVLSFLSQRYISSRG